MRNVPVGVFRSPSRTFLIPFSPTYPAQERIFFHLMAPLFFSTFLYIRTLQLLPPVYLTKISRSVVFLSRYLSSSFVHRVFFAANALVGTASVSALLSSSAAAAIMILRADVRFSILFLPHSPLFYLFDQLK